MKIAANKTYVAAYFTTTGYAADRQFFTSKGVDQAPLHRCAPGWMVITGSIATTGRRNFRPPTQQTPTTGSTLSSNDDFAPLHYHRNMRILVMLFSICLGAGAALAESTQER